MPPVFCMQSDSNLIRKHSDNEDEGVIDSDDIIYNVDLVLNMTSNIAPEPYVVTASSVWSNAFQPYLAFNGNVNPTNTDPDCWCSVNESYVYNSDDIYYGEEYIEIDLGKAMEISGYKIYKRMNSRYVNMRDIRFPLEILFQIPNDEDWRTVDSVEMFYDPIYDGANATLLELTNGTHIKRQLSRSVTSQKFRIKVTKSSALAVCIGQIILIQAKK